MIGLRETGQVPAAAGPDLASSLLILPSSSVTAVYTATAFSSSLMIRPAPVPAGEASSQAVQVWHRDNWHWYLKYERFYPLPTSQGIRVTWDDSQASCLHVMGGTAGALESFTFMWDTCASPWGTCMVVDGSSLLITPLRNTLVPPPMAAVRVTLPAVPLDTTIQVRVISVLQELVG